ncbi:cytochrome P450 [Aspergillus keveii]|uniref:Cytochrome P450 n=1 Tax=Aspergillus keveii TaxID=714993 RepID=A0ABR4GEL5_9EURO
MSQIGIAVVSLYAVLWLSRAIYRLYLHPLSRYPGSPVAAVSTSWYEWYWNYYQNGQMIFEIERLHRIHGPVIRIGVNDLHISDPAVYQDMTRVDSGFTKDPYFYQFISFPHTSIGETDPALHRIRRKVLTPALSGTRVQELAPTIVAKTEQLMRRFDAVAVSRSTISIHAAAKAFTMDIISKIVLGQEMGCIAEPSFRNEFIDFLHAAFSVGWMAPAFPRLSSMAIAVVERTGVKIIPLALVDFKRVDFLLTTIPKCLGITERYLAKFDANHALTASIAPSLPTSSDTPGLPSRSAVIDMLMNPASAKGHTVPTISELNDELIMLLTAGNDTTSNAMVAGIHRICSDAAVRHRFVDELRTHSPAVDDPISYEMAKRLPYLNATIKEILRLAHPLPGRLPRVVPAQGYTLYGHTLEARTVIHTSAYILNRHADIFDRPDEFDPDRWLGADSARLDKHLATFNRGVRQCLGKDLAWCELLVLLANLFRRFELAPVGVGPGDMEWADLVLTV